MPAWTAEVESNIRQELQSAQEARQSGQEGRARVCARRAAGLALREYYDRRGGGGISSNAYQLLQRAASDDLLPAAVRQLCGRLGQRVDLNYHLPADVDLIADASSLVHWTQQALEGEE